jgi:hypothetical protein
MKLTTLQRRLNDFTAQHVPWLGGLDGHLQLPERAHRQQGRARSHCRLAPPLIHFIPDFRTAWVPTFLKRQCDRTLQQGRRHPHHRGQPGHHRGPVGQE